MKPFVIEKVDQLINFAPKTLDEIICSLDTLNESLNFVWKDFGKDLDLIKS